MGRRSGGISLAGYPADDPYAVLNRLRAHETTVGRMRRGGCLIQFMWPVAHSRSRLCHLGLAENVRTRKG